MLVWDVIQIITKSQNDIYRLVEDGSLELDRVDTLASRYTTLSHSSCSIGHSMLEEIYVDQAPSKTSPGAKYQDIAFVLRP